MVLGGSMVKHLSGWEMSKNLDCKEYVRSFGGANTEAEILRKIHRKTPAPESLL